MAGITRVDLYDAVYRTVGLSRSESAALTELVLKEITDCLASGEADGRLRCLFFVANAGLAFLANIHNKINGFRNIFLVQLPGR